MKLKTLILELPVYWASALVNNDYSGLKPFEREEIKGHFDNIGVNPSACLMVSEDSFIGQFQGKMCDMATYTFTNNSYKVTA